MFLPTCLRTEPIEREPVSDKAKRPITLVATLHETGDSFCLAARLEWSSSNELKITSHEWWQRAVLSVRLRGKVYGKAAVQFAGRNPTSPAPRAFEVV